MENLTFRPSTYLESQFSNRLSRYNLSLKVKFSIRTWSNFRPSTWYVLKIWLSGQVRIWKVEFLNQLSRYVLGRISDQVRMENLTFRPSTYLESRFENRLSRYVLGLKVEFSICTWFVIWPSTYLESWFENLTCQILKFLVQFQTKYVWKI